MTTPASEPVANPTMTRTMLMAASDRISPLASIGIAVRNTSSGGGIKNGLKTKVERTCHVPKPSNSEAAVNDTVRMAGDAVQARNRCAGAGEWELLPCLPAGRRPPGSLTWRSWL